MKGSMQKFLLVSLIFSQIIFTKDATQEDIKFSEQEIDYIHKSKEDVSYISSDVKKTINRLCAKDIIKNPADSLLQFCSACHNDWKVVPTKVANDAIAQSSSLLEKNKDKFTDQKYQKFKTVLENYRSQLQNKEAQFFFEVKGQQAASNSDPVVFNNLVVNDTFRVNNITDPTRPAFQSLWHALQNCKRESAGFLIISFAQSLLIVFFTSELI